MAARYTPEMHRYNQTVTDEDRLRKLFQSHADGPAETGEAMSGTFFTFDTTHHALWAEEVARDAGIPAEVVPAPPAARARCNLALESLSDDADQLAEALGAAGVPHGRWHPSG